MRPLWFEYPADERTYLNEDQYLVGRDLLVAPVVIEGASKRRVYFPRGDAWVDWWTGRRHEGGTETEVDAPLGRLPLFARAGAAIPVQAVVQHTGEMAGLPLTLVLVGGGEGASSFYEDAGEGYGHLRGASHTTTVTLGRARAQFARQGGSASPRKLAAVELLGFASVSRADADGRPLDFKHDPAAGRHLAPLPAGSFKELVLGP
jgi:alpha-glucosidase